MTMSNKLLFLDTLFQSMQGHSINLHNFIIDSKSINAHEFLMVSNRSIQN